MSKTIDCQVLKYYQIRREMGSGAYGHVWQVRQKRTGEIYALKKVFDAFRNSIDAQRTYREMEVLHKLGHENIIKLVNVLKSRNNKDLYLVFNFMEADLHSIVGTNILQKMHLIFIFYQIFKAVLYIHSAQLIHRDLKPSNILINSQCRIKICDFGLIRSLNSQQHEQIILSQEVATKWYRAPQLLLGSRSYHKPVDMWSIGCIIAQLLIGKPIFDGNSVLNQFQKIIQFTGNINQFDIQSIDSPIAQQLLNQINVKNKSFREYFCHVDQDFYPLLKGLLVFNPNKRLTAQQALKLSIFEQFEDEPLIVMGKPVVPAIDDNIRLGSGAYRQKIYDDIDRRYLTSIPFKDKINQIRSLSSPKKQKHKDKFICKKKSNHSVNKQSGKQQLQQGVKSDGIGKKCVLKKGSNKYNSAPYFKAINKYILTQGKCKIQSRGQKIEKYESPVSKVVKKEQNIKSSKNLRKGTKQKVSEIDKKNILKSIGVEKPKKLQKYLK